MKPLQIIIFLLLNSSLAFANMKVPYRIGPPEISGPGCPAGTARATIAPDGSAISVLFDNFSMTVSPGRYIAPDLIKKCRIRIPVDVESGVNLEATQIDYRGYVNIPERCIGSINTEGPIMKLSRFRPNDNQVTHNFSAMSDVFHVRQEINQDFRGQCQQQRHIEFTTTLKFTGILQRFNQYVPAEGQIILDSTDIGSAEDAAITLGIRTANCH